MKHVAQKVERPYPLSEVGKETPMQPKKTPSKIDTKKLLGYRLYKVTENGGMSGNKNGKPVGMIGNAGVKRVRAA